MGPPDFSAMSRNRASKSKSNKIVAETTQTVDKKSRKAQRPAHWPFGKHRDEAPKSGAKK